MSDPHIHRIRLKGPWDVRRPNAAVDEFERHTFPKDWRSLFGETSGTAVFRRNFHRPTGLGEEDRVVVSIPRGVGVVSKFAVNGTEIDRLADLDEKYEVTRQLVEFNQLQFAVSFDPVASPDTPGGLWEVVFLEIHSRAD